ncbi:cyclin-dependent protein kinase inhibitor SMR9-like [Cannabis sativa]|uniref:Uncharacterized protein n=1 Tax=Cannabis sativa TaxID=3483 RepID=A0A803PTP7_CANSA|nr:cyclin-dependent protein kinase inhibitor SMR9 [Cannabis sativa]XP_060966553.1 cyclin-dependent protein kinase inhibitor SMR9-like [Cannabis sativa]
MGPSGRTRTRTAARKSSSSSSRSINKRKRKSHQLKKNVVERQKNEETTTNGIHSSSSPLSFSSSSNDDELPKTEGIEFEAVDDVVSTSSNSGCSTPKGKRFRIPDVVTCPPAPKKQRVISTNFSLQRTPIAFFAPPDLELFFYLAVRGISV